jgi:hypothetical protein
LSYDEAAQICSFILIAVSYFQLSARTICPEGINQPLLILKQQKYAQNMHSSVWYDYEVKVMKSRGANKVPIGTYLVIYLLIDRFAKKNKEIPASTAPYKSRTGYVATDQNAT